MKEPRKCMPKVEVIYIAENGDIFQRHLEVKADSSITEAVETSGLYKQHPECLDMQLGIFGKSVAHETRVNDGDRIEVYRSLRIDPMKKRRLRAQKTRG